MKTSAPLPGICAPLRENLWWCVVVLVRTPNPNYLRQASQNLGKYLRKHLSTVHIRETPITVGRGSFGDRAPRRESETERRAPTRDGALGGRGRYKPISSVYTCVHRIVWDMDHIVGVSHTPGTALPSRPRPAALSAENSLTDSRLAEVQYCLKLCEGEIYIEWQCVMRACLVT